MSFKMTKSHLKTITVETYKSLHHKSLRFAFLEIFEN